MCRAHFPIAGRLFAALFSFLLFFSPASAADEIGRLHELENSSDITPESGEVAPMPFPEKQRAALLAQMGVDRWHQQGIRGKGIKVAILDSGFRGYSAHLGKALPAQVLVKSFRTDGNLEAKNSQHGILCGEVIHAVAPDAELLFTNWDPERPDQFLAAAAWAREQGARVFSCSLIMPSWSDGEGGGFVHSGLKRIVGTGTKSGDIVCVASAGNTAQRHWSGSFHDDGNGWHEWIPHHPNNQLTPWGEETVSVELCGPAGTGYRVVVADAASGEEVAQSPEVSPPTPCAVCRFVPKSQQTYEVRIRRLWGKTSTFHLVVLGGSLRHTQARGSIPFPADGTEVVAVGAVDHAGHRMVYSSCGPNSAGPKPDLVAEVPFPSLWRSRPFAGTSAAAPQAAGLAALVWSAHPDWTADHLRSALVEAAFDLGPVGHDCETGYGAIRAPRELQGK